MTSKEFDAIIVGGGVVGAAVFFRLASAGKSVLLIEKSRYGQGSSGWSGGILRCFHPSALLADMATEAFPEFRAVSRNGGPEFHQCGFLYFVYEGQEGLAHERIRQLEGRTAIQWLNDEEAAQRFPAIVWDNLAGAVFEPEAGYMDPVAVSKYWIEGAEAHGQLALEGVEFNGIATDEQGLCGVHSSAGFLRTRCLILCPGAWSKKLAEKSGLSLPQSIKSKAIQLNTFASDHVISNNHPAYIDPELELYGRGEKPDLVNVGSPVSSWDIDPDQYTPLSMSHVLLTHELAKKRFKWASGAKAAGGRRRFDAYTEDEHGVIAACPNAPGVYWATGFSGGGFKLAPAIAKKIVELTFS